MGLARFPNNETLMLLEAQDLAASGQVAQAKALLLQLLEQDPNNSNAAQVLVTVYEGSGSPDSTLWAIRQAVAAGVPPSTAAAIALSLGNKYYRIGSASKIRDTLDVAIGFLAYSDSLVPDNRPKFLMGAAAFVAGDQAAQDAQKQKSCSLAKAAADYLTMAQDNRPAGLQEFRDPATQIQQGLEQLIPFVKQEIKAYCR